MTEKKKSNKNRTLSLNSSEIIFYKERIIYWFDAADSFESIINKTVCADLLTIIENLPSNCADLIILDPPYNLDKKFHNFSFSKTSDEAYINYLESWFPKIIRLLKPTGSLYLCGDWKNSACLYLVMKKYMKIQNRIVWQREKGRGAQSNWKNSCEDIWFGTLSDHYYFDVEAVKQKRKVLAPYKENGIPKDWEKTKEGSFRLTYPSNFWDDITIPYWSMPENTDHPTQNLKN